MAGNLIALVSESNGVNLAYVAGLFIAKGLCFFGEGFFLFICTQRCAWALVTNTCN